MKEGDTKSPSFFALYDIYIENKRLLWTIRQRN